MTIESERGQVTDVSSEEPMTVHGGQKGKAESQLSELGEQRHRARTVTGHKAKETKNNTDPRSRMSQWPFTFNGILSGKNKGQPVPATQGPCMGSRG